jgi:hypothetical protein
MDKSIHGPFKGAIDFSTGFGAMGKLATIHFLIVSISMPLVQSPNDEHKKNAQDNLIVSTSDPKTP